MRGNPIRFQDFRGGLNTKAAPYLVGENECRNAQNVISTVRGSIKKRNGNVTFCNTFAGSPAGITSLFGMNVAATVLIATGGTKIYSISTGGTATDITGAASLTSNLKWEFITAASSGGQGPLYGVNGTNTPKYWTGAGNIADWTASVGSVPNGTFIKFAANRVWIAGTTANPSRLFFSDIGDPRSWTATNVVDLDPNDGQTITGIHPLGPYLLVFKQKKIFLIYDLNTGANRALSTNVGCVAPRSIAEGPDGVYFLSADQGVFVASANKLTNVSDNIRTTLDGIDPVVRTNSSGIFYKDHYYLSIASFGATRLDQTLDYDSTINSWWRHSNNASQFTTWRPTSAGALELYAAQDSTSAIVDKCFVDGIFQDNSVSYLTFWTGPWLPFKEPYRRKRLRQIHIDGRGIVDAYYSTNFLTNQSLLRNNVLSGSSVSLGTLFGGVNNYGVEGVFGDPTTQGEGHIYSLGVARSFSVHFQNLDSGDMEIDAYTTMITPRTN